MSYYSENLNLILSIFLPPSILPPSPPFLNAHMPYTLKSYMVSLAT